MNDFFEEGYKIPTSNNYMKFQKGDNKFRILSKPIVGFEWWVEEGKTRKPMKVRTIDEVLDNVKLDKSFNLKHFWAMIVWNYQEEKIQILEITQKTIQNAINTLVSDDDWGAPFTYDISVKKEGEGMDTEYQTTPKPKKELDGEISALYKASRINLEALYDGLDPFSSNEAVEPKEILSK